jgi:ubiquinone/menaquinone biosynthesis C-methylase UbiE
MLEQKGRVIPAKTIPPTIEQVRKAMTLFAVNKFDDYDNHMFKTGHYLQMNAGLSAACTNGHLMPNRLGDFACGTGVVMSHVISSLLKDEIVNPTSKGPITIYGIDTTESVMAICQARVFRRISKLIHHARSDDRLSVYAVESGSRMTVRLDLSILIREKQEKMYDEVILYRDISDTLDGKTILRPTELLRVKFILEDVTNLSPGTLIMLQGLNTILVSYGFHWFIDKSAVATTISNLLAPEGRFISIEEWDLRVTPPRSNSISSEELAFHKELADAIEGVTTPIQVPKELYSLFARNGLSIVPFTNVPGALPYFKNSIDGHHDMFFGVFRKPAALTSGTSGSQHES